MAQRPGPSRTMPPAMQSTSTKRPKFCPRCGATAPHRQQGPDAGDQTLEQCRACKSIYRRAERRERELEDLRKMSSDPRNRI